MYAAVDPFYMIMLIQRLGSDYVVWDKAAAIRFLKPGRHTLFATFRMEDREIDAICSALESERSVDRSYTVQLVDREGTPHALIEKTIYIRRREAGAPPGRVFRSP